MKGRFSNRDITHRKLRLKPICPKSQTVGEIRFEVVASTRLAWTSTDPENGKIATVQRMIISWMPGAGVILSKDTFRKHSSYLDNVATSSCSLAGSMKRGISLTSMFKTTGSSRSNPRKSSRKETRVLSTSAKQLESPQDSLMNLSPACIFFWKHMRCCGRCAALDHPRTSAFSRNKMPPKETKGKKKSVRKLPKDGASSCDVRAVSDARLGNILGRLCKNAESAMNAQGIPEKTKKAMEKVCALAKEAIEQQPMPLRIAPQRKTSIKRTSRRRVAATAKPK